MGFRYGIRTLGGPDRTAVDLGHKHSDEGRFVSSYSSTFARGQAPTASKPNLRVMGLSTLGSTTGPASPLASMSQNFSMSPASWAVQTPFAAQPAFLSKSMSQPTLRASKGMPRRRGSGDSQRGGTSEAGHQTVLNHHPREARRALLETLADPSIKEIAEELFKAYDTNNNGLIEASELYSILKTMHKKMGLPKPDEAGVDALLKRYDIQPDIHGHNALNFKEFFDLFISQLRRSAFDRSNLFGREFFVTRSEGRPWDVYERMKELGVGTFGSAYLGKHRLNGQEAVVKVVKKSRAKIPIEDIEKEILVMRQVDHPHVVRLFEWYEDTSRIYLILEVLKGGTLRDVILEFQNKRKGLKEAWTRIVMRQCMEAMAYVHNLRLIHKDLKDENIMLLKKDRGMDFDNPFAVIIDLGVAEMFSLADPTGQECGGTPTTMAPEVWNGSFGPKCDVFSLGCVLFEMLAGQMPFMATTLKPIQWTRLHKKGPDWNLVRTSPGGKELCKRMLAYLDIERPSMRNCLKDEWFLQGERQMSVVKPEQLMGLKAFIHQAALKRSVLLELASKLPMHQATHIVEAFEEFDADRDGTLTPEELKHAFYRLGLKDEKLISKIFRALDVDNDGFLSFSEFAAGLLTVFQDLLEDRLHVVFQQYDEDADGYLDRDEAQEYLANAALLLSNDPASRSHNILSSLLKAGRPKISFEELKQALLGNAPTSPESA